MTADEARSRAADVLERVGIRLTNGERDSIEVTDFALGRLEEVGLQILTYVNTERVCAKELVLFAWQSCPEHRHPPVGDDPGKEETFRCRAGDVEIQVEGREPVHLYPGEQATVPPDTLHSFRAGPSGAVISEFSTRSRDELDVFSDPQIVR